MIFVRFRQILIVVNGTFIYVLMSWAAGLQLDVHSIFYSIIFIKTFNLGDLFEKYMVIYRLLFKFFWARELLRQQHKPSGSC